MGIIMTDMDETTATIKEIALQLRGLNELAYHRHEPIIADLCSRIASSDEVECVLDRMLDFVAMMQF